MYYYSGAYQFMGVLRASSLRRGSDLQQLLNLLNQERQIGVGEGEFRRGDAVVGNDPIPGTVIAQALERLDGRQGLVRAMILNH